MDQTTKDRPNDRSIHRPGLHGLWAAVLGVLMAAEGTAQELPTPCTTCGGGRFVESGAATYSVNGAVGTIRQQTDRAILNWEKFNIGAGGTVNFRQPNANSAALNRIHQNDPSRILGNLNANGQVYLINQNGIVFGQGAQVNTRALTASTLNMSNEVFNDLGVEGAIGQGKPAFEHDASKGTMGSIVIDKGAVLQTPEGGRVLVLAPEVINKGTIRTPGGQTTLAASKDKVYVTTGYTPSGDLANNSGRSVTDLRGILVEVDTGGSVSNLGTIIAERGDIGLVGLAVNQGGTLKATTSVKERGTIRLVARDSAIIKSGDNGKAAPVATRGGTLTLATGSRTEIRPDDTSLKATDGEAQPKSTVELMGRNVTLQTGARVEAPSGKVLATATANPDRAPTTVVPANDASFTMQAGSTIDVAGLNSAVVPMSSNVVEVELRGSQLADSPQQRNGPLRNKTIKVDLRTGTPFANAAATIAGVERPLDERMATGGNVSVWSEGDITLKRGATIDFSGGSKRYESGYIQTTKLVTAQGRIVDISDADPSIQYLGIFGELDIVHEKWGVTETFNLFAGGQGRFVPGYVEGKDAGSLELNGRTVNLGATLRGGVTLGPYQRFASSDDATGLSRAYDELPLRGELTLGDARGNTGGGIGPDYGLGDFALRSLAGLGADGIGRLRVYSNGRISMAADQRLDLGPGGELSVNASQIDLGGDIRAAGGRVELATEQTSTTANAVQRDSSIRVRAGATIDTSGEWINDPQGTPVGALPSGAAIVDGGDVSLKADNGSVEVARGASIDTSAGAQRKLGGEFVAGTGGDIELSVKSDYNTSADRNGVTDLIVAGDLRSDALGKGGVLKMTAPAFVIGNGASDLADAVRLPTSFFADRGFSGYELSSKFGGIDVTPGTVLNLRATNQVLGTLQSLQAPSGTSLDAISTRQVLPDYQRQAVSLALTHDLGQSIDIPELAGIDVGRRAFIGVDPGGSITMKSDGRLLVDGTLSAPAGSIDLTQTSASGDYLDSYRLWLGANARLLAPSAFIAQPSAVPGLAGRTGNVLDAGSVAVRAKAGNLFVARGAVIDVSAQGYDLAIQEGPFTSVQRVGADAGDVTLSWSVGGVFAGSIRGLPSGAQDAGGSLTIAVDQELPSGSELSSRPFPSGPIELALTRSLPNAPAPVTTVATNSQFAGRFFMSPEAIAAGGFDSIALLAPTLGGDRNSGIISFDGDVTLGVDRQLELGTSIIASNGGDVRLSGSHVILGFFGPNDPAAPAGGSGRLTVDAGLLDLRGALSLRGFGTTPVRLNSRGDIRLSGGGRLEAVDGGLKRGQGGLRSVADLQLRAQQVYVTTLSDVDLQVERDGGSIQILGGNTSAPVPLSAAGRIGLIADNVVQRGVLRAPFGVIDIDAADSITLAPGSLTSVSGRGRTIPFGFTELSQADWIYRLGSIGQEITSAPIKAIDLTTDRLTLSAGAVLDVTGGGDLLAAEWVPGPGGSRDLLFADNTAGAFAILPSLGSTYAAFDPYLTGNDLRGSARTFHFDGAPGLAAGEYAILPAAYALLPGAFLVTPDSTTGLAPGSVTRLPDSSLLTTGRYGFAGSGQTDDLASSFVVETGAQLRQRATYAQSNADRFFAGTGGVLSRDAGEVTLAATTSLQLGGTLAQASTGGRGSQVDIIADRLNVVAARSASATPGIVELVAAELNTLRADSLSIGGARTRTGSVVDLEAGSRSVEVGAGVALQQKEVLLTARDGVTVRSGARIDARGGNAAADTIRIDGDAGFVRASGGEQVDVRRANLAGATGSITIEDGATIAVDDGSIAIDASGAATIAGDLRTEQGSVSLGASRISIGTPTAPTMGLVVSTDELQSYDASELRLNSRSTVDTWGGLALTLDRLVIDAAGIGGYANAGQTVAIDADRIVLTNRDDRAFTGAPDGSGTLRLSGEQVEIRDGDFGVRGFDSLAVTGTGRVVLGGAGSDAALLSGGDITVGTARLTAGPGAATRIAAVDAAGQAAGRVVLASAGVAPEDPVTALGGRLDVLGTGIDVDTRVELPSGIVSLTATGADGIRLGGRAAIDVAGRDLDFGDAVLTSGGGRVALQAANGGISAAAGALIDVSAAPAGNDAGRLDMVASGALDLDAGTVLRGRSSGAHRGGRFVASGGTLDNGFSALNAQLAAGGFTDRIELRQGAGDLLVAAADVVRAREVRLTADGGALQVDGRIDARATSGGDVALSARDDLVLSSGASIDARATGNGERGGRVGLATTGGEISVAGGIDVAGRDEAGSAVDDGRVSLRAPRVGNGVGVATLAGDIAGAGRIDIEAFRVYTASTLDQGAYGAIASDSASYLGNAGTIKTALGVAGDPRFHVIAGEEVRSSGDLAVNGVDLFGIRPGGEAGVLTLRAGGDLDINATVSDGVRFTSADPDNGLPERWIVQTGDSWSLRLVGGAALGSADVLATAAGAGDVTLASGAVVRTGSGDIDVAAGRDVRLADGSAAIYTMGVNRGNGTFGIGDFDESLRPFIAEAVYEGDFLGGGGDVSIRAGRDIVATANTQFITDWLSRVTDVPSGLNDLGILLPTSWAINVGEFRQGVGALGGGDVDIEAGGDIENLSAMLPTTARPEGGAGTTSSIAGGGDLSIDAGGDLVGGQYYVERGRGVIDVGGAIDNGNEAAAKTVLAQGDSQLSVRARRQVLIEAVVNPFALAQAATQGLDGFTPTANYFFTYGRDSSVAVESVAGDIVLRGSQTALDAIAPVSTRLENEVTKLGFNVLPGDLTMHALSGSVRFGGLSANLFPSASGNLDIVAGDSVGLFESGARAVNVVLSDADVNLLPSVANPASNLSASVLRLGSPRTSRTGNANIPVHRGDATAARIIARDGVLGVDEAAAGATAQDKFSIYLAKQARVRAATISNLDLSVQHANGTDITVIASDGDIRFPTQRDPNAVLVSNTNAFRVEGAGRLDVIAAGDIDLGASEGILSEGNRGNAALAGRGADVSVLAGVNPDLAFDTFIDKYLGTSAYAAQLSDYLAARGIAVNGSALDTFKALSRNEQRPLVLAVLFAELAGAGDDASGGDTSKFQRGYDASAALFGEDASAGDLSMLLSTITTQAGGDINLVVPRGSANLGVSNLDIVTSDDKLSRLGVIAEGEGDVNVFVGESLLVNQTRVFALGGGDVTIWAERGDIDAGSGAKTSLSIEQANCTFSFDGLCLSAVPPQVAGNGIKTAGVNADGEAGSIRLFAPQGIVNAGDAGISSAGNITVAAVQVIGADNISAGGASVGVPTVSTGSLAAGLAGAGDVAAAATKSVTESATAGSADDGAKQAADTAKALASALTFISVEFLGYGEG